jgi:hypothetical protein
MRLTEEEIKKIADLNALLIPLLILVSFALFITFILLIFYFNRRKKYKDQLASKLVYIQSLESKYNGLFQLYTRYHEVITGIQHNALIQLYQANDDVEKIINLVLFLNLQHDALKVINERQKSHYTNLNQAITTATIPFVTPLITELIKKKFST